MTQKSSFDGYKEKSVETRYCIREKFAYCNLALWPGLIERFSKDYVRKMESGDFNTGWISLNWISIAVHSVKQFE